MTWTTKTLRESSSEPPSSAVARSTAIRRLCLCGNLRSVAERSTSRPRGPANYFPLVHSVHMIPHYLADTRWRKPYPRNQSKVNPFLPPPFNCRGHTSVLHAPRPSQRQKLPLGVFHSERRRLARPWAQLCRRCVKLTTGDVGPLAEERTKPNAIIVRREISSGCADLLRIFWKAQKYLSECCHFSLNC